MGVIIVARGIWTVLTYPGAVSVLAQNRKVWVSSLEILAPFQALGCWFRSSRSLASEVSGLGRILSESQKAMQHRKVHALHAEMLPSFSATSCTTCSTGYPSDLKTYTPAFSLVYYCTWGISISGKVGRLFRVSIFWHASRGLGKHGGSVEKAMVWAQQHWINVRSPFYLMLM